jgi:hypothetical protein
MGDMPDPPDPPPTVAWKERLAAAVPRQVVPDALGVFVGDADLWSLLNEHMGAKPCPKSLHRDLMLEAAVRLHLVNPADALVQACVDGGEDTAVAATVDTPEPPPLVAWKKKIGCAVPRPEAPQQTGVFVGDAELKKRIKVHTGTKSFPKTVQRSHLLESAVSLRLITPGDATVQAPRKAVKKSKFWGQHVEGTEPAKQPTYPSGTFVTDEMLRSMLVKLVGRVMPNDIGRKTMLKNALFLGLVTREQADIPPPEQLPMDRLDQFWDKHVKTFTDHPPAKPAGRKRLTAALAELGLISAGHAEAKAKRADVSKKIADSWVGIERTRCTSVANLFRGVHDAQKIQKKLQVLSEDASRLFHERSFLVWIHLHRLIHQGLPLPKMNKEKDLKNFVRNVYTIGTQGSWIKDDELEATLKQYPGLFRNMRRPVSYNMVTHAANIYVGAMKVHFANLAKVEQRIKRYISATMLSFLVRPPKGEDDAEEDASASAAAEFVPARPEVGDRPIWNILNALKEPDYDMAAMHPAQCEMVGTIRALLGLGEEDYMDEPWLLQNIHGSIRFTLHVADTLDALKEEVKAVTEMFEKTISDESKRPKVQKGSSRGIHFVPLNRMGRRFVTVDATDLLDVMGLPNIPSHQAETVRSALQKNISRIFLSQYDPKHKNGRWVFTGTIDTDGFSVHPHFRRPKTDEEKKPKAEAKSEAPPERLSAPPRLLLLVDPGRINIVTMTVMLDGQPVMVKNTSKTKSRPLKFTFSNRQYYTLIGDVKRATVLTQRMLKADLRDDRAATMRKKLSEASLRTGKVDDIVAYMRAFLDDEKTTSETWTRSLKKSAATERWRRQAAKEKAMLKWFHHVKKQIKLRVCTPANITEDATVVWGCKVAPTGRGNLSVPTDRICKLAKRVEKWTVVGGDEYCTSKVSCIEPNPINLTPRFKGKRVVRIIKRPYSGAIREQTRKGFVLGLDAKRIVRRAEYYDKTMTGLGVKGKHSKELVVWTYDGTSDETVHMKKTKKIERMKRGYNFCMYARGLRVYKDKETTKFVDRDVNGSINIGRLWLWDHVTGLKRPPAFVRSSSTVGLGIAPVCTNSCSPVKTLDEGRKNPHS